MFTRTSPLQTFLAPDGHHRQRLNKLLLCTLLLCITGTSLLDNMTYRDTHAEQSMVKGIGGPPTTLARIGLPSQKTPKLEDLYSCLVAASGRDTGTPTFENWTNCSLSTINITLRPRWNQIRPNLEQPAQLDKIVHRHVTVVRFSAAAESLHCIVNSSDFSFTIYDHRNGADNFGEKLRFTTNGRVIPEVNQCDEATGYLRRIVDNYDSLSDIEIFAHEDDLCSTTDGKSLLNASKTFRMVSYIPMHKKLRTLGENWGAGWLELTIRTLYAWAWTNEETPYRGKLSTQSGGSFATGRSMIRRRPHRFWKFLYDIAVDPIISNVEWHARYRLRNCTNHEDSCVPGRRAYCMYSHAYERLWGFALGQPATGQEHWKIINSHYRHQVS